MEQKKCCELCGRPARMYCESDQAILCWDCDERVHSANFLVAKHSRRLLCHVCQSPTPWAAAGRKLGPTVSVCEGCADRHDKDSGAAQLEEEYSVNDHGGDSDDYDEEEDSSDSDDYESDEDEDEEEEDGENQVVPYSCESPAPPAASSSSGEEESAAAGGGSGLGLGAKRVWNMAFSNDSDDEIGCASSQAITGAFAATEEGPTSASFQLLKKQRFDGANPTLPSGDELRRAAIIDSLKRLQSSVVSEDVSAATVLDVCRLSRC